VIDIGEDRGVGAGGLENGPHVIRKALRCSATLFEEWSAYRDSGLGFKSGENWDRSYHQGMGDHGCHAGTVVRHNTDDFSNRRNLRELSGSAVHSKIRGNNLDVPPENGWYSHKGPCISYS